MVYCTKCGKQNEENVMFCSDCGFAVHPDNKKRWNVKEKRKTAECFGLPNGGTILGLLIGIIIVIVGLQQVFGSQIDIGPYVTIIVGLLFAVGAIYGLTRRRN